MTRSSFAPLRLLRMPYLGGFISWGLSENRQHAQRVGLFLLCGTFFEMRPVFPRQNGCSHTERFAHRAKGSYETSICDFFLKKICFGRIL